MGSLAALKQRLVRLADKNTGAYNRTLCLTAEQCYLHQSSVTLQQSSVASSRVS